jgi:signal transduction histidine kinase
MAVESAVGEGTTFTVYLPMRLGSPGSTVEGVAKVS